MVAERDMKRSVMCGQNLGLAESPRMVKLVINSSCIRGKAEWGSFGIPKVRLDVFADCLFWLYQDLRDFEAGLS